MESHISGDFNRAVPDAASSPRPRASVYWLPLELEAPNGGEDQQAEAFPWLEAAHRAFQRWTASCLGGKSSFLLADLTSSELLWSGGPRGELLQHPPGGSADSWIQWLQARAAEAAATREEQVGEPSAVPLHFEGMICSLAVFGTREGRPVLVLGSCMREETGGEQGALQDASAVAASFLPYLEASCSQAALDALKKRLERTERETRKRDMLFQMALDMYAKIDTTAILEEITDRMKQFYPDAKLDLLMTQDNQSSKLAVKPLRFMKMDEDLCTRAFMEGQILMAKTKKGDYEVAVPISGKQGIYGVLHLYGHPEEFDTRDFQILKVLSGAAGSAFENAKLYEQSNLLVNELRLINELTKKLNQSLKLNEIFEFASAELIHIFRADYCCILKLDQDKGKLVMEATNHPAMAHETFDLDYGFSGIVCSSMEPVIISDYWVNPAVRSKLMDLTGSRSLIATPIVVQEVVQGVILVAHRFPGFFTYDNYKLLQVLAGHVGLALANASLHAEVRRMVITDNLTGLYARHYLDEQVGVMQKRDFCGSLILLDIDNFKKVNDTYGHQIGDQILIQVSRIIRSSIRDSDIAARWGGEELAIYLPQVTTSQAQQIAERIRHRVEEETEPTVTISCGVSEWNWNEEKVSVESLFYRSDMALYRAKKEGRNRVEVGLSS